MSTPDLSARDARLSRFLAVVLRHRPGDFGLQLDPEGFAALSDVRAVVEVRFPGGYSGEDLIRVVVGDARGKKRFEIRGGQIRALYGHSRNRVSSIEYPPAVPPETLFHGTDPQNLPAIRRDGLISMGRQYVHLADNVDRALRVGMRHSDDAVLLTINAREAHEAGIVFHNPDPEHYLARAIPSEFVN